MVWRLEPGKPAAFEMTASIEVPGHYGHSHVQAVQLILTTVSRLTAWLNAGQGAGTLPRRRLDTAEWAALLDAGGSGLELKITNWLRGGAFHAGDFVVERWYGRNSVRARQPGTLAATGTAEKTTTLERPRPLRNGRGVRF